MSTLGSSSSHNQQSVTELLTSALGDFDEDPSDSVFEDESGAHKRRRISLFWYTFGLLLTLLLISTLAGYWLLRTLDEEPRIRENTRQIVSIVMLTRAALLYVNPTQRPQIETLMPRERIHLIPRTPVDRVQPFPDGHEVQYLVTALHKQLGLDTQVAHSVNGQPGLWISFTVGQDNWWLCLDGVNINQSFSGNMWLLWTGVIMLLFLMGAVLFTRLVNRPLDALASAAMRVREGDYASSRLDETVPQTEVYEVNVHFNRMAERLARIEQERAQMLAGISHDLRTPLARLRLEVEMCVSDENARERMSSDIEQVSAILNKFLDYARPSRVELRAVNLYKLVRQCVRPFARHKDMSVQVDVPEQVHVMADAVELGRVIINLLENASRYGQTPGTGFTKVRIAATVKDDWVKLRVRDYGAGVPEEQLPQLIRPFFRGDSSRQNVAGTGLGLTIAARMIEAMGGKFRIINASSGGLQALIRLQLANNGPDKTQARSGKPNPPPPRKSRRPSQVQSSPSRPGTHGEWPVPAPAS
ncbi:MAG: HAMP domain-containing protein [Burkholderiaceae bacterium]|jgi:two-component system osmolarity sensor histidine kinase EnvZ|nr:HAMP domain-containing protein [Burkholderiaceae bacterium]